MFFIYRSKTVLSICIHHSFDPLNILLTCAGRRYYLASYFAEVLSDSCRIIGADMDLSAPALQACTDRFKVPSVFHPSYIDILIDLIIKEKVDLLFSLNDFEIGILSLNRTKIESRTGCKLYVPDWPTYQICSDKWLTYQFARSHELPVPATFLTLEATLESLSTGSISFPLIVKPRWGSGSLALFTVKSRDDLKNAFLSCTSMVQNSLISRLSTSDSVIVQELLPGSEYGVDILYSYDEKFLGFTPKLKLSMRSGETDKAITVSQQPFLKTISLLSSNLCHRGNLDCDFIECGGTLHLIELNPRFGGGYPFTHLAGANHVQKLIDDFRGAPSRDYLYTEGVAFAKYDSLVGIPT